MSLSRSVLLENSFREAGVIDAAFPFVSLDDSLASVLVVLQSGMLSRIVVVDQNSHLFGVLDREAIVREFAPEKSVIPQKLYSQDKFLCQKTCESIRKISRANLDEFSHIIRRVNSFKPEEFILYGIDFILNNVDYLVDDLLVIVNDDISVRGTVSGRDILMYLVQNINLDELAIDVESALVGNISIAAEVVICLANEPLENGLYAMTHTTAVCVLLKKNNKLVGFLTREVINQQVHAFYPDLLNCSMNIFMTGVTEADTLDSGTSLKKLCYKLIESRNGFILVRSLRGNKVLNRRKSFEDEYKIVSIKSCLEFIFSKIDPQL